MLRMLRKKMRAILIATIVIIIPAFIGFYGVGRYRGKGRSATVIAKVNGRRITYSQFYNIYQRLKESRQSVYGRRWNEEAERQTEKEALEQLIKEVLLQREAKRRRIKVSDEEILEEIKSYPYFQKEGSFDRNVYLRVLDINRITPGQFEEKVRSDLQIKKLLRQIVKGTVISDEELKEAYIKKNEKVRVKYLLFKRDDFKKEGSVEEKEIGKYFQNHREELKVPDRINAEYAMIGFKPGEVKVKEEEIINYYKKNLDQYRKKGGEKGSLEELPPLPSQEEKAKIREILINRKAEEQARKKAEDLASDLFEITAWETMVKEKKLKVRETGFFARGEVVKGIGWSPDFIEEAFSLEEDEVSNAVLTPKGYAIFIIKERSKAHLPQLEEVKDEVKEKIKDEKAEILARTKAQDCLKKLKDGNSLADTAKEFSLKVKDSGFFSRGEYIEGIGFSLSFARAAFSLQEGELSPVIKVRQGFAVLKEEGKQSIDEKKYASEAAEFRKKLFPWKQMEIYNRWYQTLRKKARIWIEPDFREKLGETTAR